MGRQDKGRHLRSPLSHEFTFVAHEFTMPLWIEPLSMGFVSDSNKATLVALFHCSAFGLMINTLCTLVQG
jgi:hypothetical protein